MKQVDVFGKGEVILASDLNSVARDARAASGRDGGLPMTGKYVSVVSRTANTPAKLSQHGYRISVPSPSGGGAGAEHDIDWTNLIVRYPSTLTDPSQPKNLTFAPAAVIGDPEWQAQPWRAWGILHHPPGVDGQDTQVLMVELFGLAPVFGCK